MDLKTIKTNPELEQQGVWCPFGDAKLLVARLNNPRMAAGYAARVRPFRGQPLLPDVEEKIIRECLADFVLLDWEGVEFDGKAFPYSRENALTALAIPDFSDLVVRFARDAENYRIKESATATEAIAKN